MPLSNNWRHVPITYSGGSYPSGTALAGKIITVKPLAPIVNDGKLEMPESLELKLNDQGELPSDTTLPTIDDTERGIAGVYYSIKEGMWGRPEFIYLLASDATEVNLVTAAPSVPVENLVDARGPAGKSAYELAFAADPGIGTLTQWLASFGGIPGPEGDSAYDVAVANGFVGTESEWLASLVGAPGNDGDDGDDGVSAYQLAVANSFSGTEAEWLASLVGAPGNDGDDGDDGASAYQLAVANGFSGTESEWLASLVGAPGNDGDDGDDGASAYELAVAGGFSGTQSQWLASLVGAPGNPGTAGAAGNSLTRPLNAALASSSGVITIDLSLGKEVYDITLTENVTGWVFSNPPAAGLVAEIRVNVTQHASAAKTCVSPATAGTAGGAWVMSTTLGAKESLGIAIRSDGSRTLFPSGVLV